MKQIFEIDWSGEQLSPEFIQLTLEMRFIEKQMNIHCGAFLNVKEITSFKDYGYCTCTVSGPCTKIFDHNNTMEKMEEVKQIVLNIERVVNNERR